MITTLELSALNRMAALTPERPTPELGAGDAVCLVDDEGRTLRGEDGGLLAFATAQGCAGALLGMARRGAERARRAEAEAEAACSFQTGPGPGRALAEAEATSRAAERNLIAAVAIAESIRRGRP